MKNKKYVLVLGIMLSVFLSAIVLSIQVTADETGSNNENGEIRDRSSAFKRGKKDRLQRLQMRKGVRNQL